MYNMKINIEKGEKFGKLTAIKEGTKIRLPSGQTNRTIECICDCGKIKEIRLAHLTRGRIKSCGCIRNTLNGEYNTIYGKLYKSIQTRTRKNHTESHLYFDKGIKMCEEWLNNFESFKKFCIKNKYKKGLYIDRIDGNKGYCPENCRFITPKESANNTSANILYEYEGNKYTISELLDKFNSNVKYTTARNRIKRGWDIYDAVTEKPIPGRSRN